MRGNSQIGGPIIDSKDLYLEWNFNNLKIDSQLLNIYQTDKY
jgi:hypothetical protein